MLLAKSFRCNLYMKEKTDVCAHSARRYDVVMPVESNERGIFHMISSQVVYSNRSILYSGRGGHWWRLNRSTDAAKGEKYVWAEDR